MLTLTRQDIINDDLGAFADLRMRLGIGAACKMNKVFWTAWLAASAAGTFLTGVRGNLVTSASLDEAGLNKAVKAFRNALGTDGNLLALEPDRLVVPPDLKWTAMELLESVYAPDTAAGKTEMRKNVLSGALDMIVSPYLSDSNDWLLLCTKRVVKPIIFQSRVPVEFAALEASSENGFMRDEYVYGVRARYNVGYGLWQLVYGSQVS